MTTTTTALEAALTRAFRMGAAIPRNPEIQHEIYADFAAHVIDQCAALDVVCKDAERYRWLRKAHDSTDSVTLWHVRGTGGQPIEAGALDAQIDEAMWQDAKVSGPSTRPPG